jgi:prepilin-type N-terminal cleavage/methylation domain-containing protein
MRRFAAVGPLACVHRSEAGFTLPELLVASLIGTMIMSATVSLAFSAYSVQKRAEASSGLAGDLAVAGQRLDADAMMALSTAPARSQTTSVDCSTAIDLGFAEGGSPVSYSTIASGSSGPKWLQRTSGRGTITVARNITACSWLATTDAGGHAMLRIDLSLALNGASLDQTIRLAPRLW